MENSERQCLVEGCTRQIARAGYCHGHYMKNWRYGTPTPQHARRWVDFTGRRVGALVAVRRLDNGQWLMQCDCGRTCTCPVGDMNRGSKVSCGDKRAHYRSDMIGYSTAHQRTTMDRGRADAHVCIDCGRQAAQWSYMHDDPRELTDTHGYAYSTDPTHYAPRCIPCHKAFDLAHADAAPVSR